ncbi:Gfo/Idh/MocA family protein [Phytoactinopolyspora halotolerans]|uniref:Gfo/Idh/MocA family oxidoreductase n=1 Tax=Phytoactinopolyspora halotolerans TaxID=1981512 RepID=A0A6L9SB09_9ACTN|nr:Gfo/Idh/MocA family oxidoreductase [Phytoactinopolyspora halotolerans]NEE02233.1 Gfo/Idh/MocA family oxidoreductase [Phytoactinopolyspora halotolerans]
MHVQGPSDTAQQPIRAAIVGTGVIAEVGHLPAVRELGHEIDLVAAVDVQPETLHQFADRWGIRGRYTALGEMLAAEAPELVIVATPPVLHREHVAEALASGAWVLCEKPPALSLAEYDQMVAGEREGGPYAPIVFQLRYGPGARHYRRLLTGGVLGRPLAVHCQTTWFRGPDYFEPAWRGNFRGDGGPAMALGIHNIDLMLTMVGPWREVSAFAATTSRDIATDDVSTAVVRFESGALGTVVNSAVSPQSVSRLRIDTELATVELTHLYRYRNSDWTCTPADGVAEQAVAEWANDLPDEETNHLSQLRAVVADLRAGRRPETSGDSGRAALELITALYASAFTGRTVKRGEIGVDDPFYHALDGQLP